MSDSFLTRHPDGWKIHCECGRWLPMSTVTECDRCGAHYETRVEQVAPPIDVEGENDGGDAGGDGRECVIDDCTKMTGRGYAICPACFTEEIGVNDND